MDKIRIAILDTGISTRLLGKNVFGGFGLTLDNNQVIISEDYEDDNGHGTGCAYAILRVVDNIVFYIIKVLNSRLKTSSEVLIEALTHLIDVDVNIINISLSTSIYNKRMEMLCDMLTKQGKIIVAAKNNFNYRSYPAEFPSVLGVCGNIFENMNFYWFNDTYAIQCVADSTPIWIPYICFPHYYMPFSSNSKAVPVFTGIIARKLLNGTKTDNLISNLIEGTQCVSWKDDNINNKIQDAYTFLQPPDNTFPKSISIVTDAFKKHTGLSSSEIDMLVRKPVIDSGITAHQLGMILYDIEQQYGKEFRLKNIDAPHVNSIFALAQLLDDRDGDE